jgi:ferritin-like metal-binding protein YciE
MAGVESLDELLQDELKDLYDAEKQLTKALPKLAKKASNEELKQAFEEHLRQTEQHIERLEQAFEHLDVPAKGKKCDGIRGIIQEGESQLREAEDDATRDALMIASAQKVEHYEIAAYGTVCTWANRLGRNEVASILEETLEEEKDADKKLTQIAESMVNPEAAEGESEEAGSRSRSMGRAMSRSGRQAAADRGSRSRSRSR